MNGIFFTPPPTYFSRVTRLVRATPPPRLRLAGARGYSLFKGGL